MDRVHDGADALLAMRHHPGEQMRYVSELSFDVRLVLCMWLLDCDLADKLASHARRLAFAVAKVRSESTSRRYGQ